MKLRLLIEFQYDAARIWEECVYADLELLLSIGGSAIQ